jgi:hypothetical protein
MPYFVANEVQKQGLVVQQALQTRGRVYIGIIKRGCPKSGIASYFFGYVVKI